jgi:cation transport ATPase
MGGHIPALGLHRLVPLSIATWVEFVLSTPVVLWAGWPFFERAWASVVNRSLNMFSLIALGTGSAYLYSVVATLAPGIFPAGFRGMDGTVAVYFEAAAIITVLVLLGQVLELSRRVARSARCSTSRLRRLVASRRTGMMKTSRSRRSRSGIVSAFARATVYPWTASFWRAPARSMSRW